MTVRFLIVGAPRTGSTLLVKTLNSLNGVRCHGELLAIKHARGFADGFEPLTSTPAERRARLASLTQQRDRDPLLFVRKALEGPEAAIGFKALYGSLEFPAFQPVSNHLEVTEDLRVIHLWRNNALRRYVSQCLMQAGGPGNSMTRGKADQALKIAVSVEAFQREVEKVEAQASRLRKAFSGHELMELRYETLAQDLSASVTRVCAFLGVDASGQKIRPALQKVGARNLADSVSNIGDLLDHEATRDFVLKH